MKKLLLLLILIAALALPVFAQPIQLYRYSDKVDSTWNLPNQFNQPVSLMDYPNRIKYLVFWESP